MTVILSPKALKRAGICAAVVVPRGAVEGLDSGFGFEGTEISFCTAQSIGVPSVLELKPKNHAQGGALGRLFFFSWKLMFDFLVSEQA